MTNDELAWKYAVPDWAESADDSGTLVVGRQLCTRDGRRTGNAHIIEIDNTNLSPFRVLTDAGTYMRLMEGEIHELYHIGLYISDPAKVIKRFGVKEDEH